MPAYCTKEVFNKQACATGRAIPAVPVYRF